MEGTHVKNSNINDQESHICSFLEYLCPQQTFSLSRWIVQCY